MSTCCNVWKLKFHDSPESEMDLKFGTDIRPAIGTGLDYANATNKPQINGVTLEGNKTNEEILIGSLTNTEIDAILNKTDLK